MSKDFKNIEVMIFDRKYLLKTTDDDSYLKNLVEELNQRIESAESMDNKHSDIQIMSLVALQILDEKNKIQKEYKQLKDLAKMMELGSNKV
ncbi:MAG: cell division protein ZapA [Firmicutes bacterium]|nr:cell division protein ZapA [Bacillota bacterium]